MAGVMMRRGEGTQERMSCEGGDRDCGDAATNQGALRRAGSHERLADTRESLWRARMALLTPCLWTAGLHVCARMKSCCFRVPPSCDLLRQP